MNEQRLDRMDYSFGAYEAFLGDLQDRGYDFVGFGDPAPGEVILRHDVDISTSRALEMARIEADYGVESTYFFLVSSPAYSIVSAEGRAALDEIERLGHDVGLHFDVHHYWNEMPREDRLTERVLAEMHGLERLTSNPVDVVSFHIPPESVLGVAFDGFRNTYAPRYFGEIDYVSDSNQKWREEPPFGDGLPETVQVLAHPGLWTRRGDSLDDILLDFRERLEESVVAYADPLGT